MKKKEAAYLEPRNLELDAFASQINKQEKEQESVGFSENITRDSEKNTRAPPRACRVRQGSGSEVSRVPARERQTYRERKRAHHKCEQ